METTTLTIAMATVCLCGLFVAETTCNNIRVLNATSNQIPVTNTVPLLELETFQIEEIEVYTVASSQENYGVTEPMNTSSEENEPWSTYAKTPLTEIPYEAMGKFTVSPLTPAPELIIPDEPFCPNGTYPVFIGATDGSPLEYFCTEGSTSMNGVPVEEAVYYYEDDFQEPQTTEPEKASTPSSQTQPTLTHQDTEVTNGFKQHLDSNSSVGYEMAVSPTSANKVYYTGIHTQTNRTGLQIVRESGIERISKISLGHRLTFRLCGYPPYTNREECRKLNYTSDPISNCEMTTGKVLFGMVIGIAATAIFIENSIIFVVIKKHSDMRSHPNYIKASLAVADAMVGILLLTTVLPNMAWIRNFSDRDMIQYTRRDVNSPTAIVVGSILTVTVQASLLHLCFLSIERFMAIQFPFWTMKRRTKSVVLVLAGIWIISVISAFLPAAFAAHFEYKFQPALLIHLFTMKSTNGTNTGIRNEGIAYTLITLILPYTIMLLFCVATAVVLFRKYRSAQRLFERTSNVKNNVSTIHRNRPNELSVYVTIVIMISTFTVTLLPFFTVVAMFVFGELDCSNYTIPYAASFYFRLMNSLANGIIYSLRDPKFRATVKRLFRNQASLKISNQICLNERNG